MKRLTFFWNINLLVFLLLGSDAYSQALVFKSGNNGYVAYRIPAIIKGPGGDLLAFCEGRVNNAGDFGNIDIVLKRSLDGGLSWSSLQIVVDADSLQAGNPAPVVDLLDPQYPSGNESTAAELSNNRVLLNSSLTSS